MVAARQQPKNQMRKNARKAFKQAKAQGATTQRAAARAGKVAQRTRGGGGKGGR